MKNTTIKKITFIAAILMSITAYPQGFVNLNFEHPILPLNPNFNFVSASNAIPGWTAYYSTSASTNQTDAVGYDTLSLGGAAVILEDTNASSLGYPPLQGSYSVLLEGSYSDTPTAAAIGETGIIPSTAQSLTFYLGDLYGTFQVFFNGQPLNYVETGSTANYGIYTADISAYASQTGQLLFSASSLSGAMLDNIQFSSTAVPEPGTLALLAVGGLLFSFRRRCS